MSERHPEEFDLITSNFTHFFEKDDSGGFPSPKIIVHPGACWVNALRLWLSGRKHQPAIWFVPARPAKPQQIHLEVPRYE